MRAAFDNGVVSLYLADAKALPLDDESVDCVVTSPPYWGLRDYGHDGQIGMEPTPAEYVCSMLAVFAEIRRVLKPQGTVWLNLGDSYAGSGRGLNADGTQTPHVGSKQATNIGANLDLHDRLVERGAIGRFWVKPPEGLKPKDLVGIPWMVSKALQAPYYTGRIKSERDRVWLAAMIDAEGTICGFDHERADGGGHRSGVHLNITNSSTALLDEAARIWTASRSEHDKPGNGHLGKRQTWRWIVHGIENKMSVLRELYPHFIVKKQQAAIAYTMLLLMSEAKVLGHSPQKDAVIAKRAVLTSLLSDLNQGQTVSIPDWIQEPPTMYEPGWWLRSDIIWAKPNPMPESVTDRPTRSHEYLFLLTKNERYYYDADAIREPAEWARWGDQTVVKGTPGTASWIGAATTKELHEKARRTDKQRGHSRPHTGFNDHWDGMTKAEQSELGRNKRDVWNIATRPYAEAHFATFPEGLVEPCILAGCPEGGLVLDPFIGSGTTAAVAQRLGRRAIGTDLNADYLALAKKRLSALSLPMELR